MPEDEPLDQDAINKAFEAGFEEEAGSGDSSDGETPQAENPTPEIDPDAVEPPSEGSMEAAEDPASEGSPETPAADPPSPEAIDQSAEEADASGATAFSMPDLAAPASPSSTSEDLDLLSDVDLNVKIELGRTRMLVEDVLRLGQGSVVELDKLAGDPVDVYVNERLVARGEILVLNDNFCVRINELVSGEQQDGQRKSA